MRTLAFAILLAALVSAAQNPKTVLALWSKPLFVLDQSWT